MRRSLLQNSWLQNSSKIVVLAVIIGLGFPPRETLASGRVCPQYLILYCVQNSAGATFTAWTNPCFARHNGLRILYPGNCNIIFNPPCIGTLCL
jgi:hypothetical protein